MDDPSLEAGLHDGALQGLGRINRLSGAARALWREIQNSRPGVEACGSGSAGGRPVRILDVASGGGDVAIALARLAGARVRVEGCDVSVQAVAFAQKAAAAGGVADRVGFFVHDALSSPPGEAGSWDVILCSLFLHHLEEGQIGCLLRHLAACGPRLLLISDLRRSRLAWWFTRIGTLLLTRSPVVHVDGPRSVRAALTVSEMRGLLEASPFAGASIRRQWPMRMLVRWEGVA